MSDSDDSGVSEGGKNQLLDTALVLRFQARCRLVKNHNLEMMVMMRTVENDDDEYD